MKLKNEKQKNYEEYFYSSCYYQLTIESMTDDSIKEEYLSKQGKYNIEKELFSIMKIKDLKNFISEKFTEYKILSALIDNKLKLLKLIYKDLSELELYFIEKYFFTFDNKWIKVKELEKILSVFDLEIKRRNFMKRKHYWYKKPIDINSIPIVSIIWKYTKLPSSLSRNIRCPFNDHKDNSASFRIYKNTNSYYCYWCHKWGNILNFIADMENISTKEAYKNLIYNYK